MAAVLPGAAERAGAGNKGMQPKAFILQLDHPVIVAAIVEAEKRSTGQIRVFVSRRRVQDALAAAARRFAKLGMEKTVARNGILIYFAPRDRKYAVVGDIGIHQRCGGDDFWKPLVDEVMAPMLKQEKYSEAIVAAVRTVGEQLAAHFPRAGGETGNELPDAVETD